MTFRIHASIALVFALLVSTLSGCGSPADRVTKRQIELINQMAAAIENEAPDSVMEDLRDQMQENAKRFEDLNLTQDEMDALKNKYETQMEEATKRLVAATMSKTLKDLPGTGGNFPFGGEFPGSRR